MTAPKLNPVVADAAVKALIAELLNQSGGKAVLQVRVNEILPRSRGADLGVYLVSATDHLKIVSTLYEGVISEGAPLTLLDIAKAFDFKISIG